jgi:hypothetical protein
MAIASANPTTNTETSYPTKRVFMRAEHKDEIELHNASPSAQKKDIPEGAIVVKRNLTYYGPKLRIESLNDGEQYCLTVPGPDSEAILWELADTGWRRMAEVSLEFSGSVPKYDFCLYCNEPLSTVAHRRRAAVGACTED